MSFNSKILATLAVSVTLLSAPASADYLIMEDPAFPSVVYFEFSGTNPVPSVVSAPAGAPVEVITAPVISGSTQNGDPALQPAASASGSSQSLEQQRLEDFSKMSAQQIEHNAEMNAIDAKILSNAQLR